MSLPPLSGPLRYLIGGADDYVGKEGEIVEYSYDSNHGATRYGTLTSEKERFRSQLQANATGKFAPYLPATDITGDYGEWMPDPRGTGFMKNVRQQVDHVAATGGERIELDNPDFRGLDLHFVLQAHDYAWSKGLHTIGKNPLLVSDPIRYLAHPSIDLVVVEHGAGGSDRMSVLRTQLKQPLLAVRFVAFSSGISWAYAVAARIRHVKHKNMGVTVSVSGEYVTSRDLIVPEII